MTALVKTICLASNVDLNVYRFRDGTLDLELEERTGDRMILGCSMTDAEARLLVEAIVGAITP